VASSVYSDFVVRARDQFTAPLRNMQRSTTAFSRNAQRSFGGVRTSLQGVQRVMRLAVAAMTTGAIAKAVTDFATVGDEVAKMSRELGLGAEALQELRFAADRQGVSSDDLETSLGTPKKHLRL